MARTRKYVLFLNSNYGRNDNEFYLKLLKGRIAIAVDGGIRFFRKNGIYPDVLIGDFDSAPRMSRGYLSNFEVIAHPRRKDKTDSQLALELALERGASEIDICGAISSSEIDHILGNIFLLDLVNRYNRRNKCRISARIMGPASEVHIAENGSIALKGMKGDYISIIPLADRVKLDYSGLEYSAPKKPLKFGDSLTLRNQLRGNRCRIDVKGKAVVVMLPKTSIQEYRS